MNWLDQLVLKRAESINRGRIILEEKKAVNTMSIGAQIKLDNSMEGEDRIHFDLSTAVGGKILNVRRYDRRTNQNDTTTYVIPNGDDLSERIVKILNLETFK